MKLIALKEHTPDGSRHLKVGEEFEISVSSANFLIATGRAKLADDETVEATEEPKKKGRYNRRDVRAAS